MSNKEILFKLYKKLLGFGNNQHGVGIGKNPAVKKLLKTTKSALRPESCYVLDHKMYLDKFDSLDLSINGIYGSFETELVKNYIKPGDVVLDIGAHIGYFTLILAKAVGDDGLVFAFEPEPKNFELLSKNIKENDYKNVELTNKAVSNKNEKCLLYVGQKSSGANRIYEPKKSLSQKFETITTETIVLDEFFKNNKSMNKIRFIKMDMEGSEFKALQGMLSILHSNKPLTIFTEFDPPSIEDSGSTTSEFLKFLKNENFDIYEIDDSNRKIIPIDVNNYIKTNFKNKTINLLCKKL